MTRTALPKSAQRLIEVSIVSHSHGVLVLDALFAMVLSVGSRANSLRVWLTLNTPEPSLIEEIQRIQWPFDLRIIQNSMPLGFGANHNQAFFHAKTLGSAKWFCVMNPDVLWPADVNDFWAALEKDAFEPQVGLVCPIQVNEHGLIQDYIRYLPTPIVLVARTLRRMGGYAADQPLHLSQADWTNGACMLWRSSVFAALGGFDERYFMYCEDVDICLRMRLEGYVMEQGPVAVVHLARRNTAKSLQHLAWHVRSLFRLWLSAAFWIYVWRFKI